jgi:mono/diheme cytochrome c family protein
MPGSSNQSDKQTGSHNSRPTFICTFSANHRFRPRRAAERGRRSRADQVGQHTTTRVRRTSIDARELTRDATAQYATRATSTNVELSSIFKALPRIVNFGLAVLVCGCAGFWLSTSPMWQTAAVGAVSPGEPDQANGRNLFFAGQCTACHASAGQADPYRLGGGRPLHISGIGTFFPPNISPDARFGIGAWSAQDFLQALRAGVSPDGRHYFPVFPYTSFARMSASDIRDLYAFLRTLPPVQNRPPPHEIRFPFGFRRAVGLWKLLFFENHQFLQDATKPAIWNRGAYLVQAVSHCAECHSRRNLFFAIRPETRFAGGPDPEQPAHWIPNITQDDQGLKPWSKIELAQFLSGGFLSANFNPTRNRMAEVVHDLSRLARSDIEAIVDYVTSLRPTSGNMPIRNASPHESEHEAMRVKVVAHEWWWELTYEDRAPDRVFTTANELHIPVDTPTILTLESYDPAPFRCGLDVLGQQFAIGDSSAVEFRADQAAIFRSEVMGECRQHTMDLLILAEEKEKFAAWREHQLEAAEYATRPPASWGLQIFLSSPCVACHSVRGTPAAGRVGPDLTHFASRHYIGAGAISRTRETTSEWIRHPDKIKPSAHMPGFFRMANPKLEASQVTSRAFDDLDRASDRRAASTADSLCGRPSR